MSQDTAMKYLPLLVGLLLLPAVLAYAEILGATNPLEITFFRQAPPEFNPGEIVEMTVSINAGQLGEPITAIGLYETIPPGWTFANMRGITADQPAIGPETGAGDVLEFAWITPPALPYSFAYALNTPPDGSGSQILSGQVEYRTNAGRYISPPVFTEIAGIDRVPPEITLQGENPLILEEGTPYIEPGFTATDNVDGDVSGQVQVLGVVNVNVPGTYQLTYTVSDAAGNRATPATRTVTVTPKPEEEPDPVAETNNSGNTGGITGGVYRGNRYGNRGNRSSTNRNRTTASTRSSGNTRASQPTSRATAGGTPLPTSPTTARPGQPVRGPLSSFSVPKLPVTAHQGETTRLNINLNDLKKRAQGTDEEEAPEEAPSGTGKLASASPPTATASPENLASTSSAAITAASPAVVAPVLPDAVLAPEGPGLLTRIRDTFANMPPGQIGAMVAVLVMAVLLVGLALIAWRVAYSRPLRRTNGAPQEPTE